MTLQMLAILKQAVAQAHKRGGRWPTFRSAAWSAKRWRVGIVQRAGAVEPAPYTDARVAFGIGLAQRGPWVAVPHAIHPLYAADDRKGYLLLMHLLPSGVYLWQYDRPGPAAAVDLDPRRWTGSTTRATTLPDGIAIPVPGTKAVRR